MIPHRVAVWSVGRSVAVRRTGVCPEVEVALFLRLSPSPPPPPPPSLLLPLFPQWLLGSRAAPAVAARLGEACSEHDNSFMWWKGAAGWMAGWMAVRLVAHIIRPAAAAAAAAYVERERERERERDGRHGGVEGLYPTLPPRRSKWVYAHRTPILHGIPLTVTSDTS